MRQDHQNYGSWFIHTLVVKAVKVDFSHPTEAFNFCKGMLRKDGEKFFFRGKNGEVEVHNGDYIVHPPRGSRYHMTKKQFKHKFKPAEEFCNGKSE